MFKIFKGWAQERLDETLALLGLVFAEILTIFLALYEKGLIYVTFGALLCLACASYLLLRRRFYSLAVASLAPTDLKPKLYMALNILFFLLLSCSIISLYLRPDLYTRPLNYFVFVALMVTIVALEIVFLPHGKFYSYFALFKIIIIALGLQWSQLLIFPSLVGIDPWAHQSFTLQILDAAHIPEGLDYSDLPTTHLMIGATSLITGVNYKMAAMFSISLLQIVCDTFFIFLLGRFILGRKVGLLAALLLGIAVNHVLFGYLSIPNTAAAILTLPIIYLLFKLRREEPIISTLLAMLLMATLILTHPIVAVYLAILLFVFWAASRIFTKVYRQKPAIVVTLTTATLFSVAMFSWWTFVSGTIETLADLIRWGFSTEYWVTTPSIIGEMVTQYISGVPFSERLFNSLGTFLFFALSLIGCFYMISKRVGNRYSFAIAISGLIVLALAFIPQLVGRSILDDRWNYFSEISLAIPLGTALLLLWGVFRKNNLVKAAVVSISTFVLCFLVIMNPAANQDNHTFSPNIGFRLAFTESELQAMDTIAKVWDGKIGADWYSKTVFDYQLGVDEFFPIDESLYSGNFSENQDMLIMIRDEIWQHPYFAGAGPIKLEDDPRIALEEQGFARIHDFGGVSLYVK